MVTEPMLITEYIIHGPTDLTIAIVADLHEHDPAAVLSILKEVSPDVIAVPGDLFENHEFGENLDKADESLISRLLCSIIHYTNKLAGLRWKQRHDVKKEHAYEFLMKASEIAPVLYSRGNHELYLTEEDKAVFQNAGVHVLNNSSVVIKNVLFGGIPSKQTSGKIDIDFLRSFGEAVAVPKDVDEMDESLNTVDKDELVDEPMESGEPIYKVLLCHHPEYYRFLQSYNIDLILSGHAHGGQIRVANYGIFSPGQGLLPKLTKGVYDGRLVVSAGCSNTASIPRWGNPCEVVVVRVENSSSERSVNSERAVGKVER